MTRSNRILNRVVLALVALALLVVGGWLATRDAAVAEALASVPLAVPALSEPTESAWWIIAASAVAIAALAVAFAVSRGRGRVDLVHDENGVRISHEVASDVLRGDLDGHPDIDSIATRAYRARGRRALLVRVATVSGSDVPRLLHSVRGAVAELDRHLERPLTLALHLTTSSRASARVRRVD